MTKLLYLTDSYLKTCKSRVLSVKDGTSVELDQTVFYPRGGGQVSDKGTIVCGGVTYEVNEVVKEEGKVYHKLSVPGLKEGDEVDCLIDWERRYRLMRMHTAGHVLASIMYKKQGILITGNNLDVEKSRFDFSLENFDKSAFQSLVDITNEQIARNLPVEVSFLPREEALKIEGAVKLAVALPPDVKELRMVKIGDVDYQADGGTHVKNTSEIGKLVFAGADNKGKNNRRVYYTLES
jgi:Ser-tRNA(Ala) deacylase AlaX